MKKFKILLPNGFIVHNGTTFVKTNKKIENELEMCKLMKNYWCKDTHSKGFQDWADDLNNDPNFEGGFDIFSALDNLSGQFHIEYKGNPVSPYDFFMEFGQTLLK